MFTTSRINKRGALSPFDQRSAVRRRNDNGYFSSADVAASPVASNSFAIAPFAASTEEPKPVQSFFPLKDKSDRKSYEQLLLGDWKTSPVRLSC